MIAKAIGPQNMVGAIGIMPSTVDIAVSMIGRKRDMRGLDHRVPDRHALARARPRSGRSGSPRCARSCRAAPGCRGWRRSRAAGRNSSSAATTPIRPIGTTLSTRNSRLKLCSCIIRTVIMMNSITRHHGEDRGLRLRALLDRAADGDVVGLRQARLELRDRGGERGDHGFGRARPARRRPGPSGSGRGRGARSAETPARNRTSRTGRAGRCGRSAAATAELRSVDERDALLVGRPHHARRRDRCRRAPA